jgi:type IV pilus assembly protein PilQ
LTPVPSTTALETQAVSVAASRNTEQFLSLRGRIGQAAAASAAQAGTQMLGQTIAGRQEYSGELISMDFQNIDLRAVLRVFADISGLNLVIDPSVQGEVNVVLTQVPWDQALAIILRANGLDYEVDATVVRIASVGRLRDEALARAQLAQSESDAGELVLYTRSLSYARAEDLVQLITSTTLSPRGEVFTDPRTNTLIIRDLQDRLLSASELLDTLDRAEPQVEIEARIVQAGHDSARALGVQWGVTGRVAKEIRNTLPFSFSNRGGIPGRAGSPDGQGASGIDTRALPDENAGTVVDLGVGGATTAIGLTMGAVNGALNLDVVLSALESQGELSIISSPRVMTQNNVQAEILQGDQIPYQTVANNTVTVQFKEAALTLRVTPQITASNTVIMQVVLENSFPDFARALGNPPIPPIVTQRATTTVQVGDGETTVIGGIYENTRSQQKRSTPVLSRIPLLGWMFRSNNDSESTDELMIFLTPNIVP